MIHCYFDKDSVCYEQYNVFQRWNLIIKVFICLLFSELQIKMWIFKSICLISERWDFRVSTFEIFYLLSCFMASCNIHAVHWLQWPLNIRCVVSSPISLLNTNYWSDDVTMPMLISCRQVLNFPMKHVLNSCSRITGPMKD